MSPKASSHSQHLVGHVLDNTRPGRARSALEFLAILGQGAYGVVYLARDFLAFPTPPFSRDPRHPLNPHGQPLYAVKCLTKVGLNPKQRANQQRELSLHARVAAGAGVVRMHNVVETAEAIFVVMDYCPGGDLFGMIVDRQLYLARDELVRSVFLQVVDAVALCHSRGVFHRDIKPENILCLDTDGRNVVLADFGLATSDRNSVEFGCGSAFYMSPECQGPRALGWSMGAYDTAASDVWALGVLLVNLACARNPWKKANLEDDTFRAFVTNPAVLGEILPVSRELEALLMRCFCLEPAGRIGLAELREGVMAVPTFTLTAAELKRASGRARAAAKAVKAARRVGVAERAADVAAFAQASNLPSNFKMSPAVPCWNPHAAASAAPLVTPLQGLSPRQVAAAILAGLPGSGPSLAVPSIGVTSEAGRDIKMADADGVQPVPRRRRVTESSVALPATPSREPRRRPSRLSPTSPHHPASTDSDSSATSASQPPTPTGSGPCMSSAQVPAIVVMGGELARSARGLVYEPAAQAEDGGKLGASLGLGVTGGASCSSAASGASFKQSWPVFARWAEAGVSQ